MTKQSNSTSTSVRPRRSPLSSRNRLAIKNKEPGYVYRIVNDVDDRVALLQEQGYEICTKETVGVVGDKRVDNASSLGSSSVISVGQGTKAVVMRQKEEYYKEDQALKQAELDELERTMGKDKSDYGSIRTGLDRQR
jgi:hypothetical protein